MYISDLFFPGNQRAICNIMLGTKYVQQIAIGNINKDCHCGLDLQYWQKAKKHIFRLDAFNHLQYADLLVKINMKNAITVT